MKPTVKELKDKCKLLMRCNESSLKLLKDSTFTTEELKKEIKSLEELNASLEGLINHFEAIGLNQFNKIRELTAERDQAKRFIELAGGTIQIKDHALQVQRVEIRVYRELLELPRCPRHG